MSFDSCCGNPTQPCRVSEAASFVVPAVSFPLQAQRLPQLWSKPTIEWIGSKERGRRKGSNELSKKGGQAIREEICS